MLDKNLICSFMPQGVEVVSVGQIFFYPTQPREDNDSVPIQVSWIRLRDWHILSTGANTFTQVGHQPSFQLVLCIGQSSRQDEQTNKHTNIQTNKQTNK